MTHWITNSNAKLNAKLNFGQSSTTTIGKGLSGEEHSIVAIVTASTNPRLHPTLGREQATANQQLAATILSFNIGHIAETNTTIERIESNVGRLIPISSHDQMNNTSATSQRDPRSKGRISRENLQTRANAFCTKDTWQSPSIWAYLTTWADIVID